MSSDNELLLVHINDKLLRTDPEETDEWEKLLRNREKLIKQNCALMEQERKNIEHKCAKRPSPDTIMQCVTGLAQVVGLAVVGWATRIDREAIRFIRRP